MSRKRKWSGGESVWVVTSFWARGDEHRVCGVFRSEEEASQYVLSQWLDLSHGYQSQWIEIGEQQRAKACGYSPELRKWWENIVKRRTVVSRSDKSAENKKYLSWAEGQYYKRVWAPKMRPWHAKEFLRQFKDDVSDDGKLVDDNSRWRNDDRHLCQCPCAPPIKAKDLFKVYKAIEKGIDAVADEYTTQFEVSEEQFHKRQKPEEPRNRTIRQDDAENNKIVRVEKDLEAKKRQIDAFALKRAPIVWKRSILLITSLPQVLFLIVDQYSGPWDTPRAKRFLSLNEPTSENPIV